MVTLIALWALFLQRWNEKAGLRDGMLLSSQRKYALEVQKETGHEEE